MLNKLKKNIFIFIGGAAILYLILSFYADYNKMIVAFKGFNWFLFPLLLLLSFVNYVSRFVKWDYYLKIIGVEIKKVDSFAIFMCGLIMSVTPGKFGELMKAYLVKRITDVPVSKTAPIIFVERITDFISVVILALFGAVYFNYGRVLVICVGIFFLTLVLLISNRDISLKIIAFLEKFKLLKKHINKIHNSYESSYIMLRPKPLILMTLLSIISWSFECLGYYIILNNFKIHSLGNAGFLYATFVYTFSTILGSITMLPGGLGLTEFMLTALMQLQSISKEISVASTVIVRIVTLWFAIFVGIVSVVLYQKRIGKIEDFNS